ncbi:hypothetical protein CcaverHIS002_0400170 [Cutaneotrichosporon cavernicola]|uniref:Glycoside hydrolase n=1 Tax=Cutaneotrichosporon cavernicola TaxID=279322 RepID=A0AA48L3C2_9TREE|nr:uncharacterized protein CcaverHIS019_0400170 [Cutaneotrichosporon cavernicola]BEI83413.1 hypothetical protein CcaverHIS002_0400170 [Cutaneotrichosporon cavernicola]BEI91197.1 hypothetical protein CcaverHIS019_0400170 [Cutaneotrichosporon cavernicola]BEI98970.1 hypothetical protein CcaverHIS631_0400130 [Cutaneotrichosporon cavernicola]BEJ06744.1 hypothetical protein CcaverHIS641_0400130 [Cutaneotrichosporon cavernicola]
MVSLQPRLEKLRAGVHQLVVDGKPFMMRAGELNNSSMSSASFMRTVWPEMQRANVNTVLGGVPWDQIEPVEGQFDFSELDQIIVDARAHDIRLVLLWFGSFKNGASQYPPAWVKLDPKRFPRQKVGAIPQTANYLSVFDPKNRSRDADANAFKRLMEHVREVDGAHGTVIMVQVENETGLLGDSRDRSELANAAFEAPVPADLVELFDKQWETMNSTIRTTFAEQRKAGSIKATSTWEEAFGKSKSTDELFMAYHYAKYVGAVAAAGKAAYPIPHYTNAWLRNIPDGAEVDGATVVGFGGIFPGAYPSGGPVETVLDIWMEFAPAIDFFSPDIYMDGYDSTCALYSHRGQPLFIPEQRRDEFGAIRLWSAIGRFNALGTSPFAIDSGETPYTEHYLLLKQAAPHILDARVQGYPMDGFHFDAFAPGSPDPSPARTLHFGEWGLLVERAEVHGHPAAAYGIIIQTASNKFFLIGAGYQIKFSSNRKDATYTGLLSFDEKEVDDRGELRTGRLLNGDETQQGMAVVMPSKEIDFGDFWFIAMQVPARTRLAECTVYSLYE